jgi:hypothetical protein
VGFATLKHAVPEAGGKPIRLEGNPTVLTIIYNAKWNNSKELPI